MDIHGLATSEVLVRAILDSNLTAVVGMDHQGTVFEFNRAAELMFGYPSEAAIGKPLAQLIIPPSLQDKHRRGMAHYMETGESRILGRRLEMMAVRARGVEFPVELTITRLELDGPPCFLGFLRDITERKEAEETLAASEAKYQDLYDNAPDMYVTVDVATAEILDCNQAVSGSLGYSKEEMIGRSVFDIYDPDFLDGARRAFRSFGETGTVNNAELRLMRKDGSKLDVILNASAVRDEDGKILHTRSILRDITERKHLERERLRMEVKVQEAQKLESLGVLAGGIAHDFNNLLVGILGNADLAMSEIPAGSSANEFVSGIVTAGRRAAELCQQLLAYSGKGQFVTEPVDINGLVREMVQLLETYISKKANVRFDLTENIPVIMADATQIRQVFMNVFTNAAEALDDGTGVISVSTGVVDCGQGFMRDAHSGEELPAGNYAYFEISDTGCGMDGETQAKIFDPFFSTKLTGRGLGLAAVSGIIRGHEGAMKVTSEAGRGTTIRVLLPVPDQPLELAEEGLPEEEWHGHGTILVVDDEETVREVGKRMLERSGFTVLSAANGKEAVRVFGEHPDEITCVILDLTMPEMDGKEAFDELRRLRSSIPIILSSGYNEQNVSELFLGKGIVGFIRKPYESRELIEKVRKALIAR